MYNYDIPIYNIYYLNLGLLLMLSVKVKSLSLNKMRCYGNKTSSKVYR